MVKPLIIYALKSAPPLGVPLGEALPMPTNISLKGKSLKLTNTLAYYIKKLITIVNCLILQALAS
jgi:hypothetical protein